MCQVPKAFKQNSFIIKLLTTIEDKTGWKEKYGEYKFTDIKDIPPRFHNPSRAEINNAIYMLIFMINLCCQYQLDNKEDADLEDRLYKNIDRDFPKDIDYAANAIINIAQIIALRYPVTSHYLELAKYAQKKAALGSNLWKTILDITVNMFLNNLRGTQLSAADFRKIFEIRMDKLCDNLQNLIIGKVNMITWLRLTNTTNPVLDESNPWAHYLKQLKDEKKPH